MAIPKYQLGPNRNRMAFFGPMDDAGKQAFANRGYELVEISIEEDLAPEEIWTIDSVVAIQDPLQPNKVVKFLDKYAHSLLAADCRIYLRCASKPLAMTSISARDLIIQEINSKMLPVAGFSREDREKLGSWDLERPFPSLAPYVAFGEDNEKWNQLIQRILSNPAGQTPSGTQKVEILNANGQLNPCTPEVGTLLQRAFFDCKEVRLHELGLGKSGPAAYRAFVTPASSHVGHTWPFQYFVKIGKRPIIAKEISNYRDTVLEHIPYHLGSRLCQDRCVLGSQVGVMVCNYVSNSETLGKLSKSGQGTAAISNLFIHTVAAWRHGDMAEDEDLGPMLLEIFPNAPPPAFRREKIAALQNEIDLNGLRAKLSAYRSSPTLMGTIHGDMHSKNVLVRNNDAILIDFEKLENRGPVLKDCAALEAGLLDDVFWGDPRTPEELLTFLRPLYCAEAFNRSRIKKLPTEVAHSFYDDVRFIRMNAKSYERQKRQYPWMLAAVMVRKACKPENQNEIAAGWGDKRTGLTPENLREILYILGAELLLSLSNVATSKNGT